MTCAKISDIHSKPSPSLEFTIHALVAERILFEVLVAEVGLSLDDFSHEFSIARLQFRVAGIDLRRLKYPISATHIPDWNGYKVTAENVALLLQGAMKDVSSKS